jgi:hypothetical protein
MFRFTIRDLLLVMVIVGLAVGWWIDRGRLSERVSYLEWSGAQVYTMQGHISAGTMEKILEEEQRQRQRFSGQALKPATPNRQ